MSRVARFKLTPQLPDEDEIHAAVASLLDRVLLPPAEWTTFPAGGYQLSAAAAARLARLGLKRSWPDLLIVYDQRIYGIELKTQTGRLSITRSVRSRRGALRTVVGQREMHPRLIAAGMRLAVCRSVDDVIGWLDRWHIPTRLPPARDPQEARTLDRMAGAAE